MKMAARSGGVVGGEKTCRCVGGVLSSTAYIWWRLKKLMKVVI